MLEHALQGLRTSLSEMDARKRKTPVKFCTYAEVRTKFAAFDHLYLEYLWGSRGLPEHTLGEIIGPEGIGKTTLAFWIAGRCIRQGMPVLYLETEGKPMLPERVMRNFSTDRAEARRMLNMVTYAEVHELKTSAKVIEEWAVGLRNTARYPHNIPALVIVDTWCKMMSPAEAEGRLGDGDEASEVEQSKVKDAKPKKQAKKRAKAVKMKDVGEASNLGHSAFAHDWVRVLPEFMTRYNLMTILVRHQNVKVDMGPGGPAIAMGQMYNKTKIGGKAFDQLAAWQLILGSGGVWRNTTDTGVLYGQEVICRMDKNGYGPKGRRAAWRLRNEHMEDTDTYLAPSLRFEHDTARWLMDTGLLGLTCNQGRYTSQALEVMAVTPEVLWAALSMRADMLKGLAQALKIEGYGDEVDRILSKS